MTDYKWVISKIEAEPSVDNLTNVVRTVHWRYSGARNGVTRDVYGSESLETPNNENFVPYEQLTKEIVVSWLENKIGQEKIAGFQNIIEAEINQKLQPAIVAMPLPWQEEIIESSQPPVIDE